MKTNKKTNIIAYFLTVLGLTYIFWFAIPILNLTGTLYYVFLFLGPFQPLFVTLAFVKKDNETTLKQFLKRCIKVKNPISINLLTFLIPIGTVIVAIGYTFISLNHTPNIEMCVSYLSSIVIMIPFLIAFNTFPEEVAWRGYILDKLQIHYSPLKASILLGFVWGIWHIPLFFITSSSQSMLNILMGNYFFKFIIMTIATSIIMTYIYNRSERSTFTAIVFHTFFNFFFGLLFAYVGINTDEVLTVNSEVKMILLNVMDNFILVLVVIALIFILKSGEQLGLKKYASAFTCKGNDKNSYSKTDTDVYADES